MTPNAVGPLLRMAQATTIHDAHDCAVDAVKAGATGEEVRQAITEWMALQAAQVQTVTDAPIRTRCGCGHGPSTHTGGHGRCWQTPCACERFRDPNEVAAARLPEHLRTDDINDYLRQKGEL